MNDPKSQQQHNQPIVTTIADNYDATTYASHSDRRKRLMSQYFNVSFVSINYNSFTVELQYS